MQEHELWITAFFNDHLAGVANAMLGLFGVHAADPAHPWVNYMAMEMVVALLIVLLFLFLRTRLSMDRPGKLQHFFEVIYEFLHGQAHEVVGHDGRKYISFFGTLFIFILFSNLIGIIPTFESPTMFPAVTAGCAIAAFLYYNIVGMQAQGVGKYLAHFAGPMPLLAPLMIPIEIVSHLARPLSLTIRLYANMLAGEKVTLVFLGLTYLVAPAVFMGLHVFVSVLQAYVFTLLTMMYVGSAVAHEEH
ncbi:MAG TPA: F0F1 ATP synthase subunit A [Bryobacteraceae bacterium]|nr:F0F1 ATP synthase subunit A [Bryobacteraceae bacterium]